MESLQDKGTSFSSDAMGAHLTFSGIIFGGILASIWQVTGGSGELIESGHTRLGDNDSFFPRSEVVEGSGFSVADWLSPISSLEQQLPPTDGPVYSEGWGGKLPFYTEPPGGFEGSLGFAMGELSTGYSAPFSDLLETQYIERQIGHSEGFTATQGFSPSDFLVEVKQVGDTEPGIAGCVVDSSIPTDISIEPKKSFPASNSQKGENRTEPSTARKDDSLKQSGVLGKDLVLSGLSSVRTLPWIGSWTLQKEQWWEGSGGKNWVWLSSKTGLPISGYLEISKMPHIRLLTRGWFAFVFSSSDDVDWVLKKVWSFADTPTILKRWTPTFDAKRERVDEEPIWVRLPGLPMQYWNTHRFAAIGNLLGRYLEADMSFEVTGYMTVARILVQINLRKGLYQEITIESVTETFVQTLDYEGIPFRCHRCHVYGHGVANFPLPFKGKDRMEFGKRSSSSPPRNKWEQQMGAGDSKGKEQQHTEDVRTAGQGSGSGYNQGPGQAVLSAAGPSLRLLWNIYSVVIKNLRVCQLWKYLLLLLWSLLIRLNNINCNL
jgi:hypothetical protein